MTSDRDTAIVEATLVVLLLGVTALGSVMITAAILGQARPMIVFSTSAVSWLVLVWAWKPSWRPRENAARRTSRIPLCIGLGIIALSGATNLVNHAQYVRADRDMGVYTAGAFWIADHGGLLIDARWGGLENAPGLSPSGAGESVRRSNVDQVEMQGTHLVPALYATGKWVGGTRGVQAMPALIGAAALAAVYLLSLRIVGPTWSVVVVAAMAANFVFIYTVRANLSEPTSLLFVSFAMFALIDARGEHRRPRLLVAGFVAGMVLAARIDGGVAIAALPATAALLACRATPRGATLRRAWADTALFVLGLIVPAGIAWIDLHHRATNYANYQSDRSSKVEILLLLGVIAAFAVLGVVHLIRSDVMPQLFDRVRRGRSVIATGAAVALTGAFGFLWYVRPLLGPRHSSLLERSQSVMSHIQQREGFPEDGTRSYAEVALDRIGWYIGPIAILLAIVGLALLSSRVVRKDRESNGLVLLAVFLPTSLLYLWAPTIYPDHPWMMRRYLPVVIPGLLLLAAMAAQALTRWMRRGSDELPRLLPAAIGAGLASLLVLAPLQVSWPARSVRWQAGGYDGIEQVCEVVGDDATVVISNRSSYGTLLTPSIRAICGVPVARPNPNHEKQGLDLPIEEIRDAVDDAGRQLWVLAPSPEAVELLAPDADRPVEVTILDTDQLASTLAYPPGRTVSRHMVVHLARVM